jgi:hypothetical protein
VRGAGVDAHIARAAPLNSLRPTDSSQPCDLVKETSALTSTAGARAGAAVRHDAYLLNWTAAQRRSEGRSTYRRSGSMQNVLGGLPLLALSLGGFRGHLLSGESPAKRVAEVASARTGGGSARAKTMAAVPSARTGGSRASSAKSVAAVTSARTGGSRDGERVWRQWHLYAREEEDPLQRVWRR